MTEAKILCDSINSNDVRITTFLVTFPRFILAEFNTHRAFSRNAASSRAIPVSRMIKRVQDNPFIPKAFGKNCKGMQQKELMDEEENVKALNLWKNAQESAVGYALALEELKVHKQYANRLLEPFAYVTDIVTATDWENFFSLRANDGAQPDFQELAYQMLDLINKNQPKSLYYGEWHIPFSDENSDKLDITTRLKVCTARCARLSYMNFDGKFDIEDDIRLHDQLLQSGHVSPFEHCAKSSNQRKYFGNFYSWIQYRKLLPNENRTDSRLIKKYYQEA